MLLILSAFQCFAEMPNLSQVKNYPASTLTEFAPYRVTRYNSSHSGGDGEVGKIIAGTLIGAGTGMVLSCVVYEALGEDVNWNYALAGGGLVVIGIPILILANKKSNGWAGTAPQKTNATHAKTLCLATSGNKLGLAFNF